jgi:hypothetical protein
VRSICEDLERNNDRAVENFVAIWRQQSYNVIGASHATT